MKAKVHTVLGAGSKEAPRLREMIAMSRPNPGSVVVHDMGCQDLFLRALEVACSKPGCSRPGSAFSLGFRRLPVLCTKALDARTRAVFRRWRL
jgi:hypothetical protein